ncbi:MAG: chemotaxis protein CheB [Myxococcota bacterium]
MRSELPGGLLLEVRGAGGLTVAQSPNTRAVDGMPGAARTLGAAEITLDPPPIARLLERLGRAASAGPLRPDASPGPDPAELPDPADP